MSYDTDPTSSEAAYHLDRKATAVALREKGFSDIDFEDWDGLCDETVLEIIAYLVDGSEIDMKEIVKEME